MCTHCHIPHQDPHRKDKVIVTAIMVAMFIIIATLKYCANHG